MPSVWAAASTTTRSRASTSSMRRPKSAAGVFWGLLQRVWEVSEIRRRRPRRDVVRQLWSWCRCTRWWRGLRMWLDRWYCRVLGWAGRGMRWSRWATWGRCLWRRRRRLGLGMCNYNRLVSLTRLIANESIRFSQKLALLLRCTSSKEVNCVKTTTEDSRIEEVLGLDQQNKRSS